MEAQSLSVKRAEVEFHNFASLGEPERVLRTYAEENIRRGAAIRKYRDFIGPLSPFLEIGANAGHTSYLLANEFGAQGFALDISADALRYGRVLQEQWGLSRAPIRVAGDAANLPFRDGSLRVVLAFQMLSQFMDIESIFLEVKRVLAPGGIFLFAEEPLRRLLSLRLYRCLYYDRMKPWERRLYDWGLLGYLVRDVIGAEQEENFGIRQNHQMGLPEWHNLIQRHFADCRCDLFVPERGWGERVVKRAAIALDPCRSEWRAARLLGGTLMAVCRKEGQAESCEPDLGRLESFLRCPDCRSGVDRTPDDLVVCANCGYQAPNEHGVYNLLRSSEKKELYPGNRADILDFSQAGHESRLIGGWYQLEGIYGNKYRWMGPHASAHLMRISSGHQRLRIRGHAQEKAFASGPVTISASANGLLLGTKTIERPGMFVIETDLPDASEYKVEISAGPSWRAPGDDRELTVNVSMIRLVPKD